MFQLLQIKKKVGAGSNSKKKLNCYNMETGRLQMCSGTHISFYVKEKLKIHKYFNRYRYRYLY
jgi:hypothetical protein